MQKGPGNHVRGLFVGIKHCIWLKIQNRYLEILHKFLQMVWKWVIIQIGKNCCLMWKGSSHRFKISVLISLNKFWNHSTSSVHVSNWEFCLRPWCIFLYFILYFVLFICRFLRNDWILAFLLMHDSISFLWGKSYQLINMYFPWVQWKSFFPHGKVRHNYLTIGQRFQNWKLF